MSNRDCVRSFVPVIIGLMLFAGMAHEASAAVKASSKPNVVVILADDMGWADVSYHSDRVKTPHIDSLVKQGVELDRFYVCPMCSPTRAGLMTGRYPIRFGLARAVIPPWRNYGMDVNEVTFADAMGKAGYKHRGVFGKWHLGHHHAKWHPLSRGFTEFKGHYNGAIDYFTLEREGERDWHHDYEPYDAVGDKSVYSTDLIAAGASDFIKRHAKDGPLFCYVPFNAPHSPFQATKKYLDMYKHLAPKESTGKSKRKDGRYLRQKLAAMVTHMDAGVGQVLKAIDDAGIKENTIVWFMSDNGGIRSLSANNLPLRGNKLSVYEGGVRVPAAVRWPAQLKAGTKVTQPLSVYDVMPTILSVVGAKEHEGKAFDGINVLNVLKGSGKTADRSLYFYHGQNGLGSELLAMIEGKWKLIVLGPDVRSGEVVDKAAGGKHQVMLFDIVGDPNEKTNLAEKNADVVRAMKTKLIAHRKLQPKNAVQAYSGGKSDFKAPKDWRIKR